jgi:hypothetical protein
VSWVITGPLPFARHADGRKVRTPFVVNSQEPAMKGQRAW